MKKWLLTVLFGLVILLIPVLLNAEFAAESSTGLLNLSVVTGGGGQVSSSTFTGNVHFGSIVSSGIFSSTLNSSFGFFDTTNKTFASQPFIDVFVFNGSAYEPIGNVNVIYRDCRVGQVNCEPRFQNSTPVNATRNVGIINITNSGNINITTIRFRLLSTCSWANLTFGNTSNFTVSPRTDLNDSLQLVYGALNQTESFQIFTWVNLSTPVPGELCNFGSEFDVV